MFSIADIKLPSNWIPVKVILKFAYAMLLLQIVEAYVYPNIQKDKLPPQVMTSLFHEIGVLLGCEPKQISERRPVED